MADVSHYLSERFGGELEKGIRKGKQWDCDGFWGLIVRKLGPRYLRSGPTWKWEHTTTRKKIDVMS